MVSLKSYYPHIGYLTQDPSVFDGTIRENLLYAVDEATQEQLHQAVLLANCEFIYDLQEGLDSEI
jgi:ABC-type multidrug transport system fused ATPase/permease subunit